MLPELMLVLLLVHPAVSGQESPGRSGGSQTVTVTLRLSRDGIHGDSSARAALLLGVGKGWHINVVSPAVENLVPTSVSFAAPPGLEVRGVTFPSGVSRKFAFAEAPLEVYEGTVKVLFSISVAAGMKTGTYEIPADVSYQACNNDVCLPPETVHLVIPVQVLPADVPAKPVNTAVFGG